MKKFIVEITSRNPNKIIKKENHGLALEEIFCEVSEDEIWRILVLGLNKLYDKNYVSQFVKVSEVKE